MSQETQIKYNEKGNFFEFPDGLRLPAIGILHIHQKLYPEYTDLGFLFSLKSGDFVKAIVADYEEDNEDAEFPYNKDFIYKVNLGNYVMFEIQIEYDTSINIIAHLVEIYTDDPNGLLKNENAIEIKYLDEVSVTIYNDQLDKIQNLTPLTAYLIGFIEGIIKRIKEHNDYFVQMPHVFPNEVHDWKDIKQMILDLRQPLDDKA